MANKFQHYIKKAIVWLVRENYFFRELKADLDELKQDIGRAKQEKAVADIKKALRDSKYISKAEMRFRRSEKIIEQIISEATTKIKIKEDVQLEEICKTLHAEAKNLLIYSHRYEGRIIALLYQLQVTIKHNEIEKTQQVLTELYQAISDVGKWVKALYTELQLAEQIAKKSGLEQFHRRKTLEKIREVFNKTEKISVKGIEICIEPLSYKTLEGATKLAIINDKSF